MHVPHRITPCKKRHCSRQSKPEWHFDDAGSKEPHITHTAAAAVPLTSFMKKPFLILFFPFSALYMLLMVSTLRRPDLSGNHCAAKQMKTRRPLRYNTGLQDYSSTTTWRGSGAGGAHVMHGCSLITMGSSHTYNAGTESTRGVITD